MLRILWLLAAAVLLAACCSGATCTSIESGTWTTAAIWSGCGGTYPQPGIDNAVIGGHTITISAGTSIEVGDGTGDAIWLNNGASRLVVNGNLTVTGGLNQRGAGSVAEFVTTTVPITFTLKNSATIVAKWYVTFVEISLRIAGSAANKVTVTTDTAAGGTAGYIDTGGWSAAMNFSHARFLGLGAAYQRSINNNTSSSVVFSDVLVKDSGQLNFSGITSTGTFSFTRFAVVDGLSSSLMNVAVGDDSPLTTGVRAFTQCAFQASDPDKSSKTVDINGDNFTFSETVWGQPYPKLASGQTVRNNNRFVENFWIGSQEGSASKFLMPECCTDTLVERSAFVSNTTDAQENPHYIQEREGGNAGPIIIRDVVVDGSGNGGTGDFLLPYGPYVMDRILIVNKGGNATDSAGNGAAGMVRNITCDNSNSIDNVGCIVLNESPASTATKFGTIQNNLFTNGLSGVVQGGLVWTEQTGFTLDHNAYFNMASLNFSNPANTEKGYLFRPAVMRVAGLITSSTSETSVVVSDATGVLRGDVFVRNSPGMYAVISAVSGTTLTLGQRLGMPGANGITEIVNGTGYTILKNYWSSGTYGDTGKGANDIAADPNYVDRLRSAMTWSTSLGGAGTLNDLFAKAFRITGYDVAGNTATYDTAYNVKNYIAYMRHGFLPQNPRLWAAGSGGTYMSGVDPARLRGVAGAASAIP